MESYSTITFTGIYKDTKKVLPQSLLYGPIHSIQLYPIAGNSLKLWAYSLKDSIPQA